MNNSGQHNKPNESPEVNTTSKAKRLLDRLKLPSLQLGPKMPPSTLTPRPHLSLAWRRVAQEVEDLSGGRFSLAKDQNSFDLEPRHDMLFKVYDHKEGCGHYSWLTMPLMTSIKQLDRWCCYCSEPMSFSHIGPSLADCQHLVGIRSGNAVHYNWRNSVEGCLTDVKEFFCFKPEHGWYCTPFTWYLEESKPISSFLGPPPTNACPHCTEELIMKKTKPG